MSRKQDFQLHLRSFLILPDKTSWLIGGGTPLGSEAGGEWNQGAWVASYRNNGNYSFTDLTQEIMPGIFQNLPGSILSMSCQDIGCAVAGYANQQPKLYWFADGSSIDLSKIFSSSDLKYIQWVSIGS